ncbi:MAG TPA: hypothetical protein VF614_18380 [Chthoniobacteraceae bacterium]|jgi:hypothetical protein
MNLKSKAALAIPLASLFTAASTFAAPLAVNSVGVYDSSNNTNTVDRTAVGNLSTFTANVATAFAADRGGVINFDGTNFNGVQGITATYGVSLAKTLTIATSQTFNNQFSNNIRAISGTENSGTGLFLFDATAGSQLFTFTFGAISGGLQGEQLRKRD